MEKMIELRDVCYRYEEDAGNYALDHVSFHVKPGEWLSIVGHNGSGKSTTIRLIDGLLEATSGDIIISGDKLTPDNVWEKRRQIGMVFQNPDNQFVGATVEDDVAFGLENQGLSLEVMRTRVTEALELVGMADFAKKEPARLSGGQKQRVALAGVLALRPDMMILDEATSMLDPEGRLDLVGRIQEIKNLQEMTVISITHDLDEVALSDRVLVMKGGRIEASLTPAELFAREDLQDLGLDKPFAVTLAEQVRQKGHDVKLRHFTEEEVEEQLWASLSSK